MSLQDLLEKKASEKTAEEIFVQSFEDELLKLGWGDELIKEAGIGSAIKAVGGKLGKILWGQKGKSLGAQVVRVGKKAKPKSLVSAAKLRAKAIAKAQPGGFKVLPGDMKGVKKVEKMRDLARGRA